MIEKLVFYRSSCSGHRWDSRDSGYLSANLAMNTRRSTSVLPFVVLIMVLVAWPLRDADAQFGIAAGANFDRLSDVEGSVDASFENASGFHIGVFYDLPLGPVALRPGVYYMDIGDLDARREDGSLIGSYDLSLIEVPVDARLRLMMPLIKPYATAGPVLRFAQTSDDDFDEHLNSFTVAANVGVGVEIGAPGAQIRLFPELRYSFGVSRIAESMTFLGQQFSAEQDVRLNTFMIRLGVAF